MKRFISGISALAIMSALVPVSAFADTTITQNDTLPKTADSSVEFNFDPTFTVTIPAKITLEDNGEGIYTNSGAVKAENVFLAEGKEIVVSLTSASKFNMQTSATSEYKLPYTASTEAFGKLTDKSAGGVIATFANSKEVQTVDVTFTTDEETQYAGSYSDPVVFTIEVKDVAASGL